VVTLEAPPLPHRISDGAQLHRIRITATRRRRRRRAPRARRGHFAPSRTNLFAYGWRPSCAARNRRLDIHRAAFAAAPRRLQTTHRRAVRDAVTAFAFEIAACRIEMPRRSQANAVKLQPHFTTPQVFEDHSCCSLHPDFSSSMPSRFLLRCGNNWVNAWCDPNAT